MIASYTIENYDVFFTSLEGIHGVNFNCLTNAATLVGAKSFNSGEQLANLSLVRRNDSYLTLHILESALK